VRMLLSWSRLNRELHQRGSLEDRHLPSGIADLDRSLSAAALGLCLCLGTFELLTFERWLGVVLW
jgi:hypothetical protein